jgi:hypothetical protein
VLVTIGRHVDGIVVQLVPAARIEGRVLTPDGVCDDAIVRLHDDEHGRAILARPSEGTMVAEAVPAGTYAVHVRCRGYPARDDYPPVVVAERDVVGLTWAVGRGATLRGKVTTSLGTPVVQATVSLDVGFKEHGGLAYTRHDGSFEIAGIAPGDYTLTVDWRNQQDITIDGDTTHDIVLEAKGAITGVVVDGAGAPLADVEVSGRGSRSVAARTDAAGRFAMRDVEPGEYTLEPEGITCRSTDACTTVVVEAGAVATTRLVGKPSPRGSIRGTVRDATGAPVTDAYVMVTIDVDDQPTAFDVGTALTAADGTFVVDRVSPGLHRVRAYRPGGGDAVVAHVPMSATVALTIHATGSIAGTVRGSDGATVHDLTIVARRTDGLEREDRFEGGRYTMRDLAAGHYAIVARIGRREVHLETDLAAGEMRTAVDLAIPPAVSVIGRIVDVRTHAGVAGASVSATGQRAAPYLREPSFSTTTDAAGRFVFAELPPGHFTISAGNGETAIDAAGTSLDAGDIQIVAPRAGDDRGAMGFSATSWNGEVRVGHVDSDGPAASSGLERDDVITAVDGIDVTGARSVRFDAAMAAPPGTHVVLGLARGTTIAIVLGSR